MKRLGHDAYKNCIFSDPLGVECRYCGFVDMMQDDDATTPRKLAAPAAMHAIPAASDTKESEISFRGTNFIIDVCGQKVMIILVNFKGVLDLCAELFTGGQPLPHSFVSLSCCLGNIRLQPEAIGVTATKRRLREQKLPDRGCKRQKYSAGTKVWEIPGLREQMSGVTE
ncbi:hypothetical protein F4859DRAFT_523402 [Xylaria cf. heliscus]|nr:hypothetical protein F4859DRAFT_523402 [Xylaria cf. heliscus]